jgi:glycogen(starch) synthase
MYPDSLLKDGGPTLGDKVILVVRDAKYLMQGSAARNADLCVPPSRFAAELVRRAYRLDDKKLRVVHNGVPEEFLHYAHRSEMAGNGPVLFFGRFHPVKGVDTLIDALRLMGPDVPETWIIGRGEEEQLLRDAILKAGLRGIRILPWMTHDELGKAISEAGMVVLPSRKENFSLAVLGAMAVGAPVIATSVGGTPEIISHERTGLLVEADDPQMLAASIRRLRDDADLARRLGNAGRERVRSEFTWDNAAQRFEGLYESIV